MFQKKVEKYWPDINEEMTFDKIMVKHVSAEVFANFEHRKFNVYCKNSVRKVIIFNCLRFSVYSQI